MFCDISNFTTISEFLPPEKTVHLLNKYFKKIHEIVVKHGGIINKFIGDAALIIFCLEPCSPQNSVNESVSAALEIIEETNKIKTDKHHNLETTIGINYGNVGAGLIGAPDRYEYTVIGDGVNIASRLEGAWFDDSVYAITISEDVFNNVSEKTKTLFKYLGQKSLKGKKKKIKAYGAFKVK